MAQGQFICPEHVKATGFPKHPVVWERRRDDLAGRELLKGFCLLRPVGHRNPIARWGGAASAVQAFSPEAKTLAQGQFICPEHVK